MGSALYLPLCRNMFKVLLLVEADQRGYPDQFGCYLLLIQASHFKRLFLQYRAISRCKQVYSPLK